MKRTVVVPTKGLRIKKRLGLAGRIGLPFLLQACVGGDYQPGYEANVPQYNEPNGGH
jgi:hypothetical protein